LIGDDDWIKIESKYYLAFHDEIEAKQTKIHIREMKSFKMQEVDGPPTKTFFEREVHRRLDRMELELKNTIRSMSISNDS